MKIGINEGYARKVYGTGRRSAKEAMLICKDAGFTVFDFGLADASPLENVILRPTYLEDAKDIKEFCDKNGLEIEQTHARFDYDRIPPVEFKPQMIRTVEATKELGANIVVIHADSYWNDDFDVTLNAIYEDYAPMVETAKRLGVKIAIETLFEPKYKYTHKRERFTSSVDELDAIVAKFNDPAVGICWDIGHSHVSYGKEHFEAVKRLKGKIIATHIHDNYHGDDMHLPPLLGDINWESAAKTLKELNYGGVFTLELVYGTLPDALLPDYLKFTRKASEYLVKKITD